MGQAAVRRNWADRIRPVWRITNRLEVLQLRLTGTSMMALLRHSPLLIVESTGRRSGRTRRTPVAYWTDTDGSFLVGGGAAGMTTVADWVLNLRAQPEAAVIVGRRRIPVRSTELCGEDRERARIEAVRRWKGIPRYEAMSGRPVPFFRLTPRPARVPDAEP